MVFCRVRLIEAASAIDAGQFKRVKSFQTDVWNARCEMNVAHAVTPLTPTVGDPLSSACTESMSCLGRDRDGRLNAVLEAPDRGDAYEAQ